MTLAPMSSIERIVVRWSMRDSCASRSRADPELPLHVDEPVADLVRRPGDDEVLGPQIVVAHGRQ